MSTPACGVSTRVAVKLTVTLLSLAILSVASYSAYVASHEPDPQETILLSQSRLGAGGPASFRVVVRNRITGRSVPGASVEISLRPANSGQFKLGRFDTDSTGSFNGSIDIPSEALGPCLLMVNVKSPLGRDLISRNVEVVQPARLLLSSDKPLYQPGQTIHLRALMLNSAAQRPFPDQAVTFEICDPNGNKVFKERRQTSTFGIASADFALAAELNLGRYEIQAIAGDETAQRTVEVQHYLLPKFKVRLSTTQSYYLPGQNVSGTVSADYIFGQPVPRAAIKLSAATSGQPPTIVAESTGQTGPDGKYDFHFHLADDLAARAASDTPAFLNLSAEVTDTAGHTERTILPLTIAQGELELAAVAEARSFVPGVENSLYVLASYPDGRPAPCKIVVDGGAQTTDAQGACEFKLTPSSSDQAVDITALDAAGHRATLTFRPDNSVPAPNLLIHPDKSVYQAGDSIQLNLLSPENDNTIYIDVLKDGQTVLTQSASLKDHQAHCALNLPATLTGAVELSAYMISADGEDRGGSRVLYIDPASGLRIATRLSKPVYRPGELAQMDLSVTDAQGHPAAAALGVAVVDEGVFAIAENHSSLPQQFLDTEAASLQPRLRLKSFDTPAQFLFGAGADQTLAAARLASLAHKDDAEAGQEPDLQFLIDKVRRAKGTADYDAVRGDPRFAEAFRLAEGGGGLYSLREATGPAKLAATRAHRAAYFSRLRRILDQLFVGAILLAPISLMLFSSLRRKSFVSGGGPAVLQGAEAGVRIYNFLGAATVFPMLWYPLTFVLLAWVESDGWLLFSMEVAVVILLMRGAFQQARKLDSATTEWDMRGAMTCIAAYIIQFGFFRAAFVTGVLHPRHFEGIAPWLILAGVVAPFIIWGVYGVSLKWQLDQRRITAVTPKMSLATWASAIFLMLVLSSMMLPSFARAKQKAQRISLISTLKQLETAEQVRESEGAAPEAATPSPPRLRHNFPETLLWQPELITDDQGKATLEIPLADSITTWRASINAVSSSGNIGAAEAPVPVFQDLFVDLDLPASMSLGDQVSVPVSCYNYLNVPQTVQLTVAAADWFASSARRTTIHLGPHEVKSASVPITALRVGNHRLRVAAQGSKLVDAVEREIRVLPVGNKIERTRNEVLQGDFADTFVLPPESIPNSQKLLAKFYPSRFSEIVEGLDSIFEEPTGCFEQTSSTTYPNVLALDYLQHVNRLTPATEARARQLINTGYQRLLTFEVPGGGFEWFGRSPAHVGLTAYGVLEFTDMSRVQTVDPAMLDRTIQWLLAQQNADGSWEPAGGLDNWSGPRPVTAYVAWALAEAGNHSPNLAKCLDYLRTHADQLSRPYEKALAANAFLAHDRNDSFGRQLAATLHDSAIVDNGKTAHWNCPGYGMTCSRGSTLDTETTALATMALMKAGLWPQTVKEALTWISQDKEADGTWGSTQGTILAMRALIEGSSASLGQEFESVVNVQINGRDVESFHVNKENSDVMQLVDLTRFLRPGQNRIRIHQEPPGELPFQLAASYWTPAEPVVSAAPAHPAPLQIDVQYDRATVPVNGSVRCAVSVRNNSGHPVNMPIIDLGIPPGFEVDASAFDVMREQEQIAKIEATSTHIVLYRRELSKTAPFEFVYRLRAKYPSRVQAPPSAVYEYYQPENRAESKAVMLQAL